MEIITKNIRGLETAWLKAGVLEDRKPIYFFLHGCPDSPYVWKNQIDEFKTQGLCVAPFLRGIGPSQEGATLDRYGLESHLLDHLEILKTVDPGENSQVIIFGHDIGAPHAWFLAQHLKKRAKTLYMINGPELQQIILRYKNLKQLIKSWYIYFFQIPMVSNFAVRKLNHPEIHPFLKHYRKLFVQGLKTSTQKTSPLDCPVHILWGKDDPYLEPPVESEFSSRTTQCTIRILDAGHWPQLQIPERINNIIRKDVG